jgi:hypothetical protein
MKKQTHLKSLQANCSTYGKDICFSQFFLKPVFTAHFSNKFYNFPENMNFLINKSEIKPNISKINKKSKKLTCYYYVVFAMFNL